MGILLSLLFFISLFLFLFLLFKFVTADGNYSKPTKPFSLSRSLSLSLSLCALCVNSIWLLKLIHGFLFFVLFFFSLGDFTLISKKHVKREEIEDKVTQFWFFNIFSFLTLSVIFVLEIICLVVLFRLFGLLELAVELVCEFLILCIVKQWQIWFALSWIYAAIDVFYGDAWMDVHVDGFDLHFIYIYIYIHGSFEIFTSGFYCHHCYYHHWFLWLPSWWWQLL